MRYLTFRHSLGELTSLYLKIRTDKSRSTIHMLSMELENCKVDDTKILEQISRTFRVGTLPPSANSWKPALKKAS